MREHRYPYLFRVAMTVLAVPATSVPSERVFSSSGCTDTANRNRLSPLMMEALQVLKFNHRNHIIDFSGVFENDTQDCEVVIPEEMSDSELAKDIRNAQATS
jgi:hypothetical protein